MLRFIFSLSAFLAVFTAILTSLEWATTKGLKENRTALFKNFTAAAKGEINADILVQGSSKALVQVSPFIIDSVCHKKTHNLGLDGNPFVPQLALWNIYKASNKRPEIILQIVSGGTLRNPNLGYLNKTRFAPYFEEDGVGSILHRTPKSRFQNEVLPFGRYAGNPIETFLGLSSFAGFRFLETGQDNGYFPNETKWRNNPLPIDKTDNSFRAFSRLHPESCRLFENFMHDCQEDKIKLFLVYPPVHSSSASTIVNKGYYEKVCSRYGAHFFDFSEETSLVNDTSFFYNAQHLNKEGAERFSLLLAEKLSSSF